jgi:peptide/nickel transport system permease protein
VRNRIACKLFANPLFWPGAFLALFFLFLALAGPLLVPHDPVKTDMTRILSPPGKGYPLGTDNLGRCVFSRLIAGTRNTIGAALVAEIIILGAGTLAGMWAGCAGGLPDKILLTLIDILLAFPGIILALAAAGLLGAGLGNLVIAFGAVYWVEPARLARSLARSIREKDFVLAARAAGSGPGKIAGLHILPHALPDMAIYGALNLSSLIIGISSFSFIGLGVRPPAPEWGALLSEGRSYMRENPRMILAAVGCVMLSAACFQFLGEALRDVLDPRKSHLV